MKRIPEIIKLEDDTGYTFSFLKSTAKIYALLFKIPILAEEKIIEIVNQKIETQITLTSLSTIEMESRGINFSDIIESFTDSIIKSKKYSQRKFTNIKLNSKDHHDTILSFIHSAHGLRCTNFKLVPMKKYKVDHLAFKVTPNLDMINSMISANSVISM